MKLSSTVPAFYPSQASVLIDRIALAAILILALFVRFYSIAVPVIWYDEAYSLLLARETPARIWTLTALDVHPPLYYVLLHYWIMVWGDSALPARALSALADVGTLLLCIKFMSLVASRRATWIAASLLALLPISISASQAVRMYPLLALWFMGATVALVCWGNSPARKRYSVIYVLLMSAAFYTHYFAVLCVLVHWVFWWLGRIRRNEIFPVKHWYIANVAIVLLYLPWAYFLIEQLINKPNFGWVPPLSIKSAVTIVWQVFFNTSTIEETSIWRGLFTVFIVACAATVLLKDRSEQRFSWLVVGCFFVPALVLTVLSMFKSMFVIRYFYCAGIGLPMIIAIALDAWWPRNRVLVIVVFAVLVIGLLQMVFQDSQKRQSLSGSMFYHELIEKSRAGDKVVFDDLFWYLPYMYYDRSSRQSGIYIGSFRDGIGGYPDRLGWALIPDDDRSRLSADSLLGLNTKRVWWVTLKSSERDLLDLSNRWEKSETLDEELLEGRLYIRD